MSDPFSRVEPPPGGLERLRARLDRPERGSWGWVIVPVGLAAIAALWVWTSPPPPCGDVGCVALGLAPAPVDVVQIAGDGGDVAVARVGRVGRVEVWRVASR